MTYLILDAKVLESESTCYCTLGKSRKHGNTSTEATSGSNVYVLYSVRTTSRLHIKVA